MRKEKFKMLAVFALLFLLILFFLRVYEGRQFRAEVAEQQNLMQLNQHEIDRLNEELSARYADDCKVERTWYGFRCTEFKTGKVFKVVM
jgi:hypothetical protein